MEIEKMVLLQLQKEQIALLERLQRLYADIESLHERFIEILDSDMDVCPWCRPLDVGVAHADTLSCLELTQQALLRAYDLLFIPKGGQTIPKTIID